jgi:hypothetical protein
MGDRERNFPYSLFATPYSPSPYPLFLNPADTPLIVS